MISNDGEYVFEDGEERPIDSGAGDGLGRRAHTPQGKVLLLIVLLSKYRDQYRELHSEAAHRVQDNREIMNSMPSTPMYTSLQEAAWKGAFAQMGLYGSLQAKYWDVLQMLDQLLAILDEDA